MTWIFDLDLGYFNITDLDLGYLILLTISHVTFNLCPLTSVTYLDVVHAYKGVLKEKEALESTLKALSLQQENVAEEGCVTEEEGVTEEADVTEEEGKEEIKGDVSEADREGRDRETEERGNEEVQPNDVSINTFKNHLVIGKGEKEDWKLERWRGWG